MVEGNLTWDGCPSVYPIPQPRIIVGPPTIVVRSTHGLPRGRFAGDQRNLPRVGTLLADAVTFTMQPTNTEVELTTPQALQGGGV